MIAAVSRLKYELWTDKPLDNLADGVVERAELWNAELEKVCVLSLFCGSHDFLCFSLPPPSLSPVSPRVLLLCISFHHSLVSLCYEV